MLENIGTLLGLVGGGLSLVNGSVQLTKEIQSLVEARDIDPALQRLISELLNQQINLQAQQIAMQSTVIQIQEEQRSIERFEAEKDRYTLIRTEQGSLMYELKPEHQNTEPVHCICAACYDRQIKSILQPVAHNTLSCGRCDGTFYKPDGGDSGIRVAPGRNTRFDGFI